MMEGRMLDKRGPGRALKGMLDENYLKMTVMEE